MSDFGARIEGRIEDRFNTINKTIKGISLEIKSVALKDSAGDWKYFHGVANTDGDLVARFVNHVLFLRLLWMLIFLPD